ncbi:MAG TPA: response regulator [Ktedonobacterales bacterium]|nr:response regulator [Ktedonobacterales bacterium]
MDLPRHTETLSGKHTQTAVRHAAELLPAGKGLPIRVIRVLILEDDPDIAESLSLVLSLDEGFAVEIVHDVATCLERLQASTALTALSDKGHQHTFDVLLLDMLLGAGHVGTEVLAAAVAIPHLELPPVVVCTGLSRAYLAGFVPGLATNNIRVLLKPFDIDTLMTELRVAANVQKHDQI